MTERPKHRKRDIVRGLFSKRQEPTSTLAVPTSTTSSSVAVPSQTSPSPQSRHVFSEDALQTLTGDERTLVKRYLAENGTDATRAVEQAYDAAVSQKQTFEKQRGRITFRGREVVLRDEADKVVRWIERFKSVGDVVANVDPVHIGLPWAGIRMILEVMSADNRQMAGLLSGMNMAMYMTNRLRAYLEYLASMPRLDTTAAFEKTLVKMYALVLCFLVDAISSYQKSPAARAWEMLWKESDLDQFERKCNELSVQVDIDARNCDRAETKEWRENLNRTLQSLTEIRDIRSTLSALQYKVDLTRLAIAQGATHNSYEEEGLATCLKGTRVDLIQQIESWAQAEHGEFIFWLCGKAGTGKSTISRTVAHIFERQGKLGASFFFKRGEGDRGNASRFFPTIAVQLADVIPGLSRSIATALDSDHLFSGRGLQEHFEKLVLQPLRDLSRDQIQSLGAVIVVIDAMDECERSEDIRKLLQLMARADSTTTIRLLVFVTSRPELPIKLGFGSLPGSLYQDVVLEKVQEPTIEHDIHEYFSHQFVGIRREASIRWPHKAPLPVDWPGESNIEKLVQLAVPLFIFASTICRFISEANPQRRLESVLNPLRKGSFSGLERTYLPILEHIILSSSEWDQEAALLQFREIVGCIVVLADPLSAQSLGNLLNIDPDDIESSLENLHSVLEIPDDPTKPIRLLHLSFRDFLVDAQTKDRNPFWVDEAKTHELLADRCLQLLMQPGMLREDICDVRWPGFQRLDIDEEGISDCIVSEIAYACSYWVFHQARSGEKLRDGGPVHIFLQQHLLCWLEALSWLGRLSDVVSHITTLQSLLEVNLGSELSSLLYDAHRFVLRNRFVIDLAPLQTYSSAMIFTPEQSAVRQMFASKHPVTWLRLPPNVPLNWGAEILKLEGHREGVDAVAFSPDGQTLASASWDLTIRLWDTRTGQEIQKIRRHDDVIRALAFSRDGTLASGSDDGTVRLWDARTGEQMRVLKGHDRGVNAVAFSSDGTLASGSHDRTVRLWDTRSGEEMRKLTGHGDSVYTVAFSLDGTLATGSDDCTIRLWDIKTGKETRKLGGHERCVCAVAFSPDGTLASASRDETVRLWDTRTGEETRKLEGHRDYVFAVAFSPDGQMLASGSGDETVRLWNTMTNNVQELNGHEDVVRAVVFSPDGQMLVSASTDHSLRVWSKTGEEVQKSNGHHGSVGVVVFSPDGLMLASGSVDNTVQLWDTKTGEQTREFEGHQGSVYVLAFSPDGRMLASGSDDHTVRLWDTKGHLLQKFEGHKGDINAVAFSADEQTLASGSSDHTVRIWDTRTGEQTQELRGHNRAIKDVVFSLDGQILASASRDQTVRLWNTGTGEEMGKLEGHEGTVNVLIFSPDGSMLASGPDQEAIRLWDVRTCKEIHSFRCEIATGELALTSKSDVLKTDAETSDLEPNIRSMKITTHATTLLTRSNTWIQYAGEDLLWLPKEYRGRETAVFNETLVIGQTSGAVSLFEFDTQLLEELSSSMETSSIETSNSGVSPD